MVVPTHDRAAKLARLLRSFDAQAVAPLEVIVVDDASSDGTRSTLAKWARESHAFQSLSLRHDVNQGPAAARNAGWRRARGETIAFTDDDCIADRMWTKELIAAFDSSEALSGVGGRVAPLRRDVFSRYYTHYRILEPPPSRLYLVTANAGFRRTAIVEAGGFSERLRAPGGEDVELSIRVRRLGWQLGYSEWAIVEHDYRRGLRDFMTTFRNYGRGCRDVAERLSTEVKS